MPDTSPALGGTGDHDDVSEWDVDPRALRPWPRLRGRPRRITYSQVFARSLAILGVGYGLIVLWLATEPYRRQMDPFQKGLFPIWVVIIVVLAIIAAPLSALVLSAVWWFCWGSWNPHVSDLARKSEASGPDEDARSVPGGDADAESRARPGQRVGRTPHQRRDMLRAKPNRSG